MRGTPPIPNPNPNRTSNMEYLKTIQQLKRYFSLGELVDARTLKERGEFAWAAFDPCALEVLLWLREGLGIPLVVNTKDRQQRGLRTNVCEIVKAKTLADILYLSGHNTGKAFDINAYKNRMTPDEIRAWIVENIDTCPHPIRLEEAKSAPTWVHFDTMNTGEKSKLIWFKG